MTDCELLEQWLQPGASVPVTMEATRILVEVLRAKLAQPEPEPVGYFYNGRFSTKKNAPGIGIYGVPVYIAPPQREWVGLTDEEIDASLGVYDSFGGRLDARKIEAKLKEKNAND